MKDFNFFSPYIKVNRSSRVKKTYILVIASIMIIVFSGSMFWTSYSINSVKTDIAQMNKYLSSSQIANNLKSLSEKKRRISIMNQYYNTVLEVSYSVDAIDKIGTEMLTKISNTIPRNISFNMISVDTTNIQIQGISESRVAIAELQYNLKSLDLFSEVHVIDISKESDEVENYVFTLKCTLKDVG